MSYLHQSWLQFQTLEQVSNVSAKQGGTAGAYAQSCADFYRERSAHAGRLFADVHGHAANGVPYSGLVVTLSSESRSS